MKARLRAQWRPFRALRYRGEAKPGLISVEERLSEAEIQLARTDPLSPIHLSQPLGAPDDRSKFVRLARASAELARWRREGVVATEPTPSYYRAVSPNGEAFFIGLLNVGPESELWGDQVESSPFAALPMAQKAKRQQHLEATGLHLELPIVHPLDPVELPSGERSDHQEWRLDPLEDRAGSAIAERLASVEEWEIVFGADRLAAAVEIASEKTRRGTEVAEDWIPVAVPLTMVALSPDSREPTGNISGLHVDSDEDYPNLPTGLIMWSRTDF